jgi:ATP-dependent Clp protease adaptor protein ClpS
MDFNHSNNPKEKKYSHIDREASNALILFNDDHNLYDFVIDSLVEVCKHDTIQAEQCTLIAHHKGKCDVRVGSFNQLKPMKDELINRGLSAVIVTKN